MAEAHPVGFQWVMEAKARGAKVIHVDPRFTRTSALADTYVPMRAGHRHRVARRRGQLHPAATSWTSGSTCVAYTNAATIVSEDFADTEDLDGLFSGFDPETRHLRPVDAGSTRATRSDGRGAPGPPDAAGDRERGLQHESHGAPVSAGHAGARTRRCSTPAASTRSSSGTSPATPPRWSSRPAASRRRRSSSCARPGRRTPAGTAPRRWSTAVGWTQHSVGVQYIRTGAIIQLLLGNMGRPGGGIMALRGHASIQGSTDIPTLFNLLPGLPADAAPRRTTPRCDKWVDSIRHPGAKGFWGNAGAYGGQPAQGLLGRRGHRRRTTSATTTCRG